jgi:ComF family protein
VNICSKIARFVLPPVCQLCGAEGLGPDICAGCFRDLPRVRHACTLCARPLARMSGGFPADSSPSTAVCGRCLTQRPPWHAALAPLRYDFPVARMLQELKYEGRLLRARLLGELLGHWARRRRASIEVLLPVPLHPRRWRQRGFNQARELAAAAGRTLRLKLVDEWCLRLKDTPPLWDLPAGQRRRVLKNAFKVADGVRGRRIALVDDVLTTGATASIITQTLLRAGAARVEVWTIARAGLSQTGSKM